MFNENQSEIMRILQQELNKTLKDYTDALEENIKIQEKYLKIQEEYRRDLKKLCVLSTALNQLLNEHPELRDKYVSYAQQAATQFDHEHKNPSSS